MMAQGAEVSEMRRAQASIWRCENLQLEKMVNMWKARRSENNGE
jgi:hypothetical protein